MSSGDFPDTFEFTDAEDEEYGAAFDGEWAEDGDSPLPSLLDVDVQTAVESWKCRVLGRRPKDFMARDMLLNSLFRDERPRLFHSLCKRPPAWLRDHVAHLPELQQDQAIQLGVLQLLHHGHLLRMNQGSFRDWDLSVDGDDILKRLSSCWPYGALMAPPKQSETVETDKRCCCGLSWLCPWCYARRAVKLYPILQQGPLKERKGKHLVKVCLRSFGAQARPDDLWAELWQDRCLRTGITCNRPRRSGPCARRSRPCFAVMFGF